MGAGGRRGDAHAGRDEPGVLAVGDPHREQVHLGPVNDEAVAPFGGTAASGTGARFGGEANLDAFTDLRWTTVRGDVAGYPF